MQTFQWENESGGGGGGLKEAGCSDCGGRQGTGTIPGFRALLLWRPGAPALCPSCETHVNWLPFLLCFLLLFSEISMF